MMYPQITAFRKRAQGHHCRYLDMAVGVTVQPSSSLPFAFKCRINLTYTMSETSGGTHVLTSQPPPTPPPSPPCASTTKAWENNCPMGIPEGAAHAPHTLPPSRIPGLCATLQKYGRTCSTACASGLMDAATRACPGALCAPHTARYFCGEHTRNAPIGTPAKLA